MIPLLSRELRLECKRVHYSNGRDVVNPGKRSIYCQSLSGKKKAVASRMIGKGKGQMLKCVTARALRFRLDVTRPAQQSCYVLILTNQSAEN